MTELILLCIAKDAPFLAKTLDTWKSTVTKMYVSTNDDFTYDNCEVIPQNFINFSQCRNDLIDYAVKKHPNCYIIFIDDTYELVKFDTQLTQKYYMVNVLTGQMLQRRTIIQKVTDGVATKYFGDYHEALLQDTTEFYTEILIFDNNTEETMRRTSLRKIPKTNNPYNEMLRVIEMDIDDTKKVEMIKDIKQSSPEHEFMKLLYLSELDLKNYIKHMKNAARLMRPDECFFKLYCFTGNKKYLDRIKSIKAPIDNLPINLQLYEDLKQQQSILQFLTD